MALEQWLEWLRCPEDGERLALEAGALRCARGHRASAEGGIARLVYPCRPEGRDARWGPFYDRIAPLYDLTERAGSRFLLGVDVRAERAAMIRWLQVEPGMRLLEVSPGPGVAQALLAEALGQSGSLVEVDLSLGMLRVCRSLARRGGRSPLLVQANAAHLPFADETFDAVFHFGGVKLFSEPARALDEMARVVKPGGRLAWGDEGFGPSAPQGWRSRLLSRMNPGFLEPRPSPPHGVRVDSDYEAFAGCAWLTVGTKL